MHGRNLRDYVAFILRVDAKNFSTVEDFWQRNAYFFKPITHSRHLLTNDHDSSVHGVPLVNLVRAANKISEVETNSWDATSLHEKIAEAITSFTTTETILNESTLATETKPSDASQRVFSKALHLYLRWALAEGMPGPGIGDILTVLGRSVALDRLNQAADLVKEQPAHRCDEEVPRSEAVVL